MLEKPGQNITRHITSTFCPVGNPVSAKKRGYEVTTAEFLYPPEFLVPTLSYTSVKENLLPFLHTGLYALLWFESNPKLSRADFFGFLKYILLETFPGIWKALG